MTIYVFLGVATMAHAAPDNVIQADGPITTAQLEGHIDYYLDHEWDETVSDMLGKLSQAFKPVPQSEPDFGYTKDKVWLRLTVKNVTDSEDEWRLHMRENFKQVFDVYVVRDNGDIDHALSLDRDTTFEDRPISFSEMVAPVTMFPGETVTIFLAYWSEGSSHLAFSLQTSESFSEIAVKRMAKNFIYYGMMVILIFAAFVAMLVLRETVFPAYIAYAVATLVYIMHADGVAFQYLWPSFPRFNSIASVVTGTAVIVFCATYARVFLQTKIYHPIMDKLLFTMVIFASLMCVSTLFVDPQPIKKLMIFVALLTLTLCTLAGLVAARTRFKEVRFYVLAWVGAVVSSLIMNMRHIIGIDLTQDLEFDSMRIAMVFDAAMMGLAIADRFTQLRKSRQKAMQKSLNDAERNLELNSRLHELEQQYVLASELVQSRDEEMKNTVHDLRQPLHALRLNVKNLIDKRDTSGDDGTNINDTFAYLEGLIASHLQNTIEPPDKPNATNAMGTDDDLTTPQVLKSIYEMFLPDAVEKGLSFRFVPTRHRADIEPLVLMRIISNLVSNAIKYTSSGKILLGTRRRGSHLRIEVHDTGPGMTPEEFNAALNRDVRLDRDKDRAEGHGYGLAIAKDLAEKNNLELYQALNRENGTGIILQVNLKAK